MINPLIHKHPGDTLHCVYCVLDFIDSLPNEDLDGASLNREQVFGYFCILRCLKDALKFEYTRNNIVPDTADDELPHPAKILGGIENIKHHASRNRLLTEFDRAIELCDKPEKLA